MGDIATHAAIAVDVIAVLKQDWPQEENYEFFELGNWLTDMSQFRDPYSMLASRMAFWETGEEQLRITGRCPFYLSPKTCMEIDTLHHFRFNDFVTIMMGTPGQDGAFTNFLHELVFVFGCEHFRGSKFGITPDQFEETAKERYTQYFPHEHLDFPPWPHRHPESADRSVTGFKMHVCGEAPAPFQPPARSRQVMNYLDDQIKYVAELLTYIEQNWVRLSKLPKSPDNLRERRKLLTLYGHASHAVEDFYFHSNFVEIAWAGLQPPVPLPLDGPGSEARKQRNFYRRRRGPVYSGGRLSTTTSVAADTVFTGSFGDKDVYHTFMDAFEGLTEHKPPLPGKFGQFIDQLATDEGRRKMVDVRGAERTKFISEWRNYADNDGAKAADDLVAGGVWNIKSGDAFKRALALDKAIHDQLNWDDFVANCKNLRGPFAVLTEILCQAQAEHDLSDNTSASLDTGFTVATGFSPAVQDASDNGASAERIGCHSLMAKDSPRKTPLRQPAVNLATWTACYIARVMAGRLNAPPVSAPRIHADADPDKGSTLDAPPAVDWLHLLQHFLCHPEECEGQWHKVPLLAADSSGARSPTLPGQTQHTIRPLPAAEVSERVQRKMEATLKQKYTDLEQDAERDWQNRH
jgi:hypothetical protein